MITNRDITIRCPERDSRTLIERLASFCRASNRFRHLRDDSHSVSERYSFDALVVEAPLDASTVRLVFASSDGATMSLSQIPAPGTTALSVSDLNRAGVAFVRSLRAHSKEHQWGLAVTISSDQLTLEGIIPAPSIRSTFQQFVERNGDLPTTRDYYDSGPLDTFTCILARHPRTHVNLRKLGHYLVAALGWPEQTAERIVKRIYTGLDVLEASKKL